MTADSAVTEKPTDLCGCGHEQQAHDLVATKYCVATYSHTPSLVRNCICKPGPIASRA